MSEERPDAHETGRDAGHGIRVAHFPPPDRDPYLILLARALSDLGVTPVTGASLSLSWLWRNRRRPCVLHVHWPSLYYETTRSGPVQNSLLRALLLCLFLGKLMLAKGLGFRLLWTAHNLLPHGPHGRLYRLERAITCRWLWHGVIAHCDGTLETLRRRFGFTGVGVVSPHGSLAGYYPPPAEESVESARAALAIPTDRFVYLHFGKIRPYKGLDLLIAACRKLAAERAEQDWLLLIAGDGEPGYVDRLQAQCNDMNPIHWRRRRIPDSEVSTCFLAADAVVLPYRRVTTSGNAVLALAFGKRLVIPNLGCLPATAPAESAAIYTPDDDGSALADALRRVRTLDPDRAACAARDSERRRHWPDIGEQTVSLYRYLLDR